LWVTDHQIGLVFHGACDGNGQFRQTRADGHDSQADDDLADAECPGSLFCAEDDQLGTDKQCSQADDEPSSHL
jgi:hypothetical protein